MLDKEYLKEGGQLNDAMVEALVLSDLLKDSKQGRDAAKSRGLKELTAWVPPIPLEFRQLPMHARPLRASTRFFFSGFQGGYKCLSEEQRSAPNVQPTYQNNRTTITIPNKENEQQVFQTRVLGHRLTEQNTGCSYNPLRLGYRHGYLHGVNRHTVSMACTYMLRRVSVGRTARGWQRIANVISTEPEQTISVLNRSTIKGPV